MEPLSRSLHVIVHDPRGCGRSTHYKSVCTIDQMANDVAALLEHLNVRSAHIIGHSMGWSHRSFARAKFSGQSQKPGPCRRRFRSGPLARVPRPFLGCPIVWPSISSRWALRKYLKHEICDTDTYFTPAYRNEHRDKVQAFYEMVWRHHARLAEYLQLCIARHNWEANAPARRRHRSRRWSWSETMTWWGAITWRRRKSSPNAFPTPSTKSSKDRSHGFFWQAPEETNEWILQWVHNHT